MLVTRSRKGAWVGTCPSCSSSTSAHPEAAAWWPILGYRKPPAIFPYRGRLWNPGAQRPSQLAGESVAGCGTFAVFWICYCSAPSSLFWLSDPSAAPQPLLLLNLGTCFPKSIPCNTPSSLFWEASEWGVAAERLRMFISQQNSLFLVNLVLKGKAYC